jgi:hypothetical protein
MRSRKETHMGEANRDMVADANEAEEAKAEARPGDEKAYEDSWYQVLKARQTAAETTADDAAEA